MGRGGTRVLGAMACPRRCHVGTHDPSRAKTRLGPLSPTYHDGIGPSRSPRSEADIHAHAVASTRALSDTAHRRGMGQAWMCARDVVTSWICTPCLTVNRGGSYIFQKRDRMTDAVQGDPCEVGSGRVGLALTESTQCGIILALAPRHIEVRSRSEVARTPTRSRRDRALPDT